MASTRKRKWKSPDGTERSKWVVEYTDSGGKRRRKTLANKKDADNFRAKVTIEVSHGVHTPDWDSLTIAQAFNDFIRLCEDRCARNDGVAPQSIILMRGVIKNHIVPFIVVVRLNQLSAIAVQRWVDDMLKHKTKPRTAYNIKEAMNYLRQVIVEAQRRGFVARNVIKDVPPRRPQIPRDRAVIPTKDEVRRLLSIALSPTACDLNREDNSRTAGIVTMAIFTGMRGGEIRALKWEYVDLQAALIRVRHSVDDKNNLRPPKSWAGVRDIPIPPILVGMLAHRHSELNPDPSAFVFHNWRPDQAMKKTVFHRNGWFRILDLAQLLDGEGSDRRPRYHFHHLRHFAASAFIEQGLQPKRIQELMGHTSVKMTFDLYGHLFPDSDAAAQATRNIEAMLIPSTRQESDKAA